MARRTILVLLLTLAICPYFIDLGGSSIWDANEAFYVETPREMMERGDYVSPTFNYEPRLNKPILSYWIVAAFYHIFGVSVAVQRVPIAIGAVLLIAAAFFLGRAAAPDTRTAGAAAWWAALGLAISPRLVMFARRIFIDIYISMFMALTLLFFALAERYPARRRLWLMLMYVCVGLGVLTKGPIAVVLPGLVFACYLLAHRELRRVREMFIPAGILLVLAIVVPWYAALYQRSGWTHITSFFVGENFGRYTEPIGPAGRGPLFYLPVVFTDSFPWSFFLIGAAAIWWADRRDPTVRGDIRFKIRTLLWLWILITVGFFSFSRTKQDLYIFSIVPAVAALAGDAIARFRVGDLKSRWWVRATPMAVGVLLLAGGIAAFYLFGSARGVYELAGVGIVTTGAVAGGAAAALLSAVGRARAAVLAVVAAILILNWTFVLRVLPGFERYKAVPALSDAIRQRAVPADAVAHYRVGLPSMVFYLRRHIDVFYGQEEFVQMVTSDRRVFAVLARDDYEALRPRLLPDTCVLARRPTFDVRLKNILYAEAPPELLLISNQCAAQVRYESNGRQHAR